MRRADGRPRRAARRVGPVALVGLGQRLAVDDVQRRVEQQQVTRPRRRRPPRRPSAPAAARACCRAPSAGGAGGAQHVDQRGAVGRRRSCAASADSRDDGEDRPLDRPQHRLVGAGRGRRAAPRRPCAPLTRRRRPSSVDTRPRRIWLRITPLLPRAPISEPWLMASQVASRSSSARSPSRRPPRRACAPCWCRCRRRAPDRRSAG